MRGPAPPGEESPHARGANRRQPSRPVAPVGLPSPGRSLAFLREAFSLTFSADPERLILSTERRLSLARSLATSLVTPLTLAPGTMSINRLVARHSHVELTPAEAADILRDPYDEMPKCQSPSFSAVPWFVG